VFRAAPEVFFVVDAALCALLDADFAEAEDD
jgi:hypothetical protein